MGLSYFKIFNRLNDHGFGISYCLSNGLLDGNFLLNNRLRGHFLDTDWFGLDFNSSLDFFSFFLFIFIIRFDNGSEIKVWEGLGNLLLTLKKPEMEGFQVGLVHLLFEVFGFLVFFNYPIYSNPSSFDLGLKFPNSPYTIIILKSILAKFACNLEIEALLATSFSSFSFT